MREAAIPCRGMLDNMSAECRQMTVMVGEVGWIIMLNLCPYTQEDASSPVPEAILGCPLFLKVNLSHFR